MKIAVFVTSFITLIPVAALAQQPPPPFVPIVIDQEKWAQLSSELDKVSMPPPVYRAIMGIFGSLEDDARRAEQSKIQAQPKEK